MIIWINGAFGSGKTQTAYELSRRIKNSYVYDPENAGYFICKNIPKAIAEEDFQDYSMWRSFNFDMLDYIAKHYDGTIIVPMTIANKIYYNELIVALSEKYELKHFILCAEKETILKRLASRFESDKSWAALQIDRCLRAFDGDINGYKIQTDKMNICQVAEKIAGLSRIILQKDDRSGPRKFWDRLVTKYRHIR